VRADVRQRDDLPGGDDLLEAIRPLPAVRRVQGHGPRVGEDQLLEGARSVTRHGRQHLDRHRHDAPFLVLRRVDPEHAELVARRVLHQQALEGHLRELAVEVLLAPEHVDGGAALPLVRLEHERQAEVVALAPGGHAPPCVLAAGDRQPQRDLGSLPEPLEDRALALADEAAEGHRGVGRGRQQGPGPDPAPAERRHRGRVEEPGGPELVAADAVPAPEQEAPASPGGEPQREPQGDHEAQDPEAKGSQVRGLEAPDVEAQTRRGQRREAYEERCPGEPCEGEPEREAQGARPQDAGAEVGREAQAREEARHEDHPWALALEPCARLLELLLAEHPGQGRDPGRGAAEQAARCEQEQVPDEDPREAGQAREEPAKSPVRNEQARGDAGQVLAPQGGECQQEAGQEEREPGDGRQVVRPQGARGLGQARGRGVLAARRGPGLDASDPAREVVRDLAGSGEG